MPFSMLFVEGGDDMIMQLKMEILFLIVFVLQFIFYEGGMLVEPPLMQPYRFLDYWWREGDNMIMQPKK